ncbi:GNAT family N-acetyltransferase [Rhizobium herbae]|uniref:RimJ/RimL family protein N-acetyltransferase n=1 Tax=Rhizobium herbae TaxID=508661 RepID=A0ABS4EHG0_9HYPH|nr:GNAT family N-acetyltransferase [Rhizobium herbae]MBP1857382.1 RimJ/RimL family protein N-acetyltransferase [Rhizobium herbae]
MIVLETQRLRVRNWLETDRPLFAEINADPKVMEFFPRRRSRQESDALMDEVRRRIGETGLGFFALALKDTDEPIGFLGLARTDLEPCLPDGTVEIGWRLAVRFWRHGYVTEASEAMLRHGFETHGLAEIVSFAVENNTRSTAVMQRLGLRHDPARDFVHPRVPDTAPHLRRHVLYAISRDEWLKRQRRA